MEVKLENLNKIDEILAILKNIENCTKKENEKIWLSVRELAIYLDYSEDRIHKLKGKQLIEGDHYFKISGKLLFKKSRINAWIQSIGREKRTSQINIDSLIKDIIK